MRIGGISLFPFIILREQFKGTKEGDVIVNHETIHFQQQLELLVLPFYVLYILNFIINICTMNPNPYKHILFEKEAFYNESNMDYLKTRKRYSWLKLIKK